MAKWRTKACELFGAKAGQFSYKTGVVSVADDLHDALARAIREGDEVLIPRIFEYAQWADAQPDAGHLRSALDILFFMKVFRDPAMEGAAAKYLPADLVEAKRVMASGIVE